MSIVNGGFSEDVFLYYLYSISMKKLLKITIAALSGILLISTSLAKAPQGEDFIVTIETINEKNDISRYEITVHYPQTEYLSPFEYLSDDEPIKRLNYLLKSLVNLRVKQFKTSAAEFYADASADEILQSYQDINYSEYRAGPMRHLVSFVLSEDRYFIGTAHPTGVRYFSVTYDITNQRRVKLYHLFKGGSNYLEKFLEYSTESLKFQLGEDAEAIFLPDGVAPKWYNFKNFALKEGGITFFFSSYQVAPYYAGPQEVTIPYSELKEYINPQGTLGFILEE